MKVQGTNFLHFLFRRRTLQCDNPYESEGKIGVFACRAPIRPNPVAITNVKVEKIDQENHRIYISKIEAFDYTPFWGIIDYDVRFDQFPLEEVKCPVWTREWPEHIVLEGN